MRVLLMGIVLLLTGCAGSPVHTSSMSRNELMGIDDYTLCKAATPRELYDPSANVMMEVRRRGLDCRSVYTYTPAPVIVMPQQQQQNRTTQRTITCTRMGDMSRRVYTFNAIACPIGYAPSY